MTPTGYKVPSSRGFWRTALAPSAQGELTLSSGGGSHLAPLVSCWEFSFSRVGKGEGGRAESAKGGRGLGILAYLTPYLTPPGLPSPLPGHDLSIPHAPALPLNPFSSPLLQPHPYIWLFSPPVFISHFQFFSPSHWSLRSEGITSCQTPTMAPLGSQIPSWGY